jgi:hypothetical protein
LKIPRLAKVFSTVSRSDFICNLAQRRVKNYLMVDRLSIHDPQARLLRRWQYGGTPGNLKAMHVMRDLVRASCGLDGHSIDSGLQRHAIEVCEARRATNDAERIAALFFYCRDQVYFVPDPVGSNDIETPREVIAEGFADCDGKSVLLAAMLGLVGISNLGFKAARYVRGGSGYQHVYPVFKTPSGRSVALDSCPVDSVPGWEATPVEALTLPVLDSTNDERLGGLTSGQIQSIVGAGSSAGLSAKAGNTKGAILTGAALGVSFIPVVGPILAPVVGLIAGLFHHGPSAQERQLGSNWDQADKQTAAFFTSLEQKAAAGMLTGTDMAEAVDMVTQLAQLTQQYSNVKYVAKQWRDEAPRYANLLQVLSNQVAPGSEGTTNNEPANSSSSSGGGSGVTVSFGASAPSMLAGQTIDLGKALLYGAGGLLAYKLIKG